MSGPRDQPQRLDQLLNTVAGRLRKVDLRVIDEIRQLWPTLVDPVLAEHCRPEFVKSGVLLITVPSGAFAQRVLDEGPAILAGLSALNERAPTSIRTVLTTA